MMTLGKLLNETTLVEAKPKLIWKKIGDQYTVAYNNDPKQILGVIMKQAKSFNDQSASYEVEPNEYLEFKKFPKIKDAKKYVEAGIEAGLGVQVDRKVDMKTYSEFEKKIFGAKSEDEISAIRDEIVNAHVKQHKLSDDSAEELKYDMRDRMKELMRMGESINEAKYRDGSVLADLQVAWNKYRFNQDQGNAKQAVKFKKSALKLWGVAKRMDSEARNASGKLWKDVIDGDVSDDSGRKPKIVKMSETSLSTFSKELLGEDVNYAKEIASAINLREPYVKSFMEDNNIDGYDFLGVIAKDKMSTKDINTALIGNPNNSYFKKLMKLL